MSHKSETQRRRELGDFGEDRALQLLIEKGLEFVEKMPRNFHFFDLMARRDGRNVLFPVKTRSKHTAKGNLKTNGYNHKEEQIESVKKIASFFNAKVEWIAVTVDTKTKTYSAYNG
jgi:Holliday junction resolvase-like predicted endonuclease